MQISVSFIKRPMQLLPSHIQLC